MDPLKGGGGVAPQFVDPNIGEPKFETARKVSTKGVELSVTTSHISGDNLAAKVIANSMALSMGLVAPKLLSPADLALLLKTMQSKVEQSMISLSKTDIERIQKEQKDSAEVRLKKLEEQVEKANKAQKGGLFGKIFGWIAAAFMAIAGAILMATGVGSAAGAALLVGGIAMMTAMALSEPDANGVSPMSKFIGALAKSIASTFNCDPKVAQGIATGIVAALFVAASAPAFIFGGPAVGVAILGSLLPLLVTPDNLMKMGASEELAQKLGLGLTIGMAVVTLAVTLGPMVASGVKSLVNLSQTATKLAEKLAGPLTKAATEGADVAKEATAIAKFLAGRLNVSAQALQISGERMSSVAQIISGVSMVGGGVSAGVATKFADDANKARAEEKLLNAFLLKLQDQFQTEKDRLEEMVRRLMNFDPIASMMESTHQAAAFVERHS